MLRNFTTLEDLKAYIPNLDNLLWTENEDYSAQIEAAEREVRDDFTNMGLAGVYLRPDLTLNAGTSAVSSSSTSDAINDNGDRKRWVANVTALTSTATLTLSGSNEEDGTFITLDTMSITETGLTFKLIPKPMKYYKLTIVPASGSVTVESYLTESVYDTLFIFKTLIIILNALVKASGDQWDIKRMFYVSEYDKILSRAKLHYDTDLDEVIETGETIANNVITYYK